jgi:DMSO/TMAO reductase YedYZ molybdopterin-dependent catalytic subunit
MLRFASVHFVLALLALCWSAGIAAQAAAPVTITVSISGNVAEPVSLTVADLKRYPAHEIQYVAGRGADHKTGDEPARQYTGCLLRDVLAAAKPTESKRHELRKSYIVAAASDGYEVVFSWAELFISPIGDSVYIVYARDGVPLADDEGRIALIAVTDTRPARHVKWLQTLMLRAV